MSARLTRHATDRAHQRLGLGFVAAERLAEAARTQGLGVDEVAGQLRRWMLFKIKEHPGTQLRIYGTKVFVFGRDEAVITILNLPKDYQRAASRRALRKAQPV
jgi:hypothetical protein